MPRPGRDTPPRRLLIHLQRSVHLRQPGCQARRGTDPDRTGAVRPTWSRDGSRGRPRTLPASEARYARSQSAHRVASLGLRSRSTPCRCGGRGRPAGSTRRRRALWDPPNDHIGAGPGTAMPELNQCVTKVATEAVPAGGGRRCWRRFWVRFQRQAPIHRAGVTSQRWQPRPATGAHIRSTGRGEWPEQATIGPAGPPVDPSRCISVTKAKSLTA